MNSSKRNSWNVVGPALALCSLGALVAAGLGTRWGWWGFRMGFSILRGAAITGLCAAAVSLLELARRGGRRWIGGAGFVVGLVVAAVPANWYRTAKTVPPIHDITTDTESPPRFVAVLALRRDAPNSADYAGAALAEAQRKGYPGLGPALLSDPPDRAFSKALDVARASGWEIVAAVPQEGRIEATDTTLWFGFKDDIVVRVTPSAGGSRIDVRSVSRVGKSDVGTNARRIEKYLAGIKEAR